jgi:hypothetical protein
MLLWNRFCLHIYCMIRKDGLSVRMLWLFLRDHIINNVIRNLNSHETGSENWKYDIFLCIMLCGGHFYCYLWRDEIHEAFHIELLRKTRCLPWKNRIFLIILQEPCIEEYHKKNTNFLQDLFILQSRNPQVWPHNFKMMIETKNWNQMSHLMNQ